MQRPTLLVVILHCMGLYTRDWRWLNELRCVCWSVQKGPPLPEAQSRLLPRLLVCLLVFVRPGQTARRGGFVLCGGLVLSRRRIILTPRTLALFSRFVMAKVADVPLDATCTRTFLQVRARHWY